MRYVLLFVSAVALAAGCGNNSFDTGNPLANLPSICEDDGAPDGCGDFCETASSCGSGTFCQDGLCDAVCTPEGGQCGSAGFCSSSGRCIPITEEGGAGGNGGGSECQSVQVTPTRSIPNVMFLVDRSGSMTWELDGSPPEFGEDNRWQVAHDAIASVIDEVDSIVRFGLATYHWNDDEYSLTEPRDPECPILGPVGGIDPFALEPTGFALNNAATILTHYQRPFPNDPSGGNNDTPTGDSIDALVAWMQAPENRPPQEGPNIIVLATDGEPDTCEIPDGNQSAGRGEAVAAATNAFAAGFQTFVLSVGSQVGQDHLQDMANVGVGLAEDGSEGNAEFWVGTDPVGLQRAFREIVGNSISCEVEIDKPFANVEQACQQGDVRLNGSPITCPDGWRVKPGANNIIELVGGACATFKEGVSELTAEFPCGAVVVQ